MGPSDLLLWAVRAVSLFNTVAFLWLGLTVLLNAQRRVAGSWITGGGLLLAGLFFTVHSTLVGREFGSFDAEMAFWWRILWLLFVIPPFLWYVVVSWYSGSLGTRGWRAALVVMMVAGGVALGLPATADLMPPYEDVARGAPVAILSLSGAPVAILVYPTYSAACYLLALVALRRPLRTSKRFMGDLGRRRALPWLVAASVALVAVSLGAGSVAARFLQDARTGQNDLHSPVTLSLLMEADLAISVLLAVVVVLQGRAIVSYEIFTGKTLPRGGLSRHWRNSLILAGGYGIVMGGSLSLPVDPIYRLMLATLLVTLFYGLLSWRSYLERERSMGRLRPFVASQRLYERMLAPIAPQEVDVAVPLRALCEDVLDSRLAYLVALGPLAPLSGSPLAYPDRTPVPTTELGSLPALVKGPEVMVVPLDPHRFRGAVWAVPLWSERGLIGALLLGEKRGGGLYVQEEIEIARATGERLIDLQASAEMARRLVDLQRRRMGQTHLLDHRARRALHDDVLPRLHATLLLLNGVGRANEVVSEAVESLSIVHRQISDLLSSTPVSEVPEVERLGVMGALRQVVEVDLGSAFDGVEWRIEPEAERAAGAFSPLVAEVLYGAAREAVRNAARHGRGRDSGKPLHLAVSVTAAQGLRITIEDDGVGLGASSGKEEMGSGQGLALHSTLMAVVGGTLSVDAAPGGGTRVSLTLPEERNQPLAISHQQLAVRPGLAVPLRQSSGDEAPAKLKADG